MRPTFAHRTRMARQHIVSRVTLKPGPGFHLSHPHDTGPGPHSASRPMGETSSSSSGISERKKDPRVPCSLGSKGKSKPNFNPRKQKARRDSERHQITFLAFRGCLRSLYNPKLLYFSKTLICGTLDSKNLRYF